MVTQYTDEDRRRILASARATLAAKPEPYAPQPERVFYKTHEQPDSEPEPERERAPKLDTAPMDWSAWDAWVSDKIDAALAIERQEMLKAVAKIVGKSLGDALADAIEIERARSQRELHELRVEAAKLSSAVAELHNLLAGERSKIVDLPALPLRRAIN